MPQLQSHKQDAGRVTSCLVDAVTGKQLIHLQSVALSLPHAETPYLWDCSAVQHVPAEDAHGVAMLHDKDVLGLVDKLSNLVPSLEQSGFRHQLSLASGAKLHNLKRCQVQGTALLVLIVSV